MGAGPDTVADVKRCVQFLRDASYKDILEGTSKMTGEMSKTPQEIHRLVRSPPFVPVMEPSDSNEAPFFTQHPNDILVAGDFSKVPMIIGVNNKEGSLIYQHHGDVDEELVALQANPTLLLPKAIFRADANTKETLSNKIKDVYMKNQPITSATLPDVIDLHGDEAIFYGAHVAKHWHLKHATPEAPVYQYFFTLDAYGIISFLLGAKSLKGAGHGDDLGYVFKNHLVSDAGTADKERVENATARMTTLISNFVLAGNPTPSKTDVTPVEWTPATPEKPVYLDIGDNLTLQEGPILKERMQFWSSVVQEIIPDPVFVLT